MNLQKIVDPLGEFLTWTFDMLIVPFADFVNLASVLLGAFGLLYWLNLQNKYSKKAQKEGGIV